MSEEWEQDAMTIFEQVEKGLGANLVLPGGGVPLWGDASEAGPLRTSRLAPRVFKGNEPLDPEYGPKKGC